MTRRKDALSLRGKSNNEPLPEVSDRELLGSRDPLAREREEAVDRAFNRLNEARRELVKARGRKLPDFGRMTVREIGAWFRQYRIWNDVAVPRDEMLELEQRVTREVWTITGRDNFGQLTPVERRRQWLLGHRTEQEEESSDGPAG